MDDQTRARIRHLCFVERIPLGTIAEWLRLSPRAVRAALVVTEVKRGAGQAGGGGRER